MVFASGAGKYQKSLVKCLPCLFFPAASLALYHLTSKKKILAESKVTPYRAQYLVIGTGPTAYSALRTIRYLEPSSRVLLASDSKYLPYERYPLNLEAWLSDDFTETFEFESRFQASASYLFFQPQSFYLSPTDLESVDEYGGQGLLLKHRFTHIDPEKRLAFLENGDCIQYEKCLLALGSKSPKLLLKIPDSVAKKFHVLDNLDDFLSLKAALSDSSNIAVVGDSLKALEFASTQSTIFKGEQQRKVTLICSRPFLSDYLPQQVADWIRSEVESSGVKIVENVDLGKLKVRNANNRIQLDCGSNQKYSFDDIVTMLPRIANSKLASESCLETDSDNNSTIVADSTLKVRSDLYAAGSCVSFYHPIFQNRLSFDSSDHSVISGRFAAFNMMGKTMPYFKLPRTVADFGADLGFDGVGRIDPNLDTETFFIHKSQSLNVEKTSSSEAEAEQLADSSEDPNNDSKDTESLFKAPEATSSDTGRVNSIEVPTNIDGSESKCSESSSKNIGDDPILSCAIVYLKDDTVVGVATIGSFGRMFIAENMISHKVKRDQLVEFLPLLLGTKFSLKKPSDEEDSNMFS